MAPVERELLAFAELGITLDGFAIDAWEEVREASIDRVSDEDVGRYLVDRRVTFFESADWNHPWF
jgi:hypothetical protein